MGDRDQEFAQFVDANAAGLRRTASCCAVIGTVPRT